MARDLTMTRSLPRWLITLCVLSTGAGQAAAPAESALPDPMRPPDAARGVVAASSAASAVAAPRVWPKLQALRYSASGTSNALIDGRLYRVGERVGDTTLVAIRAQSIVLHGAGFSQQVGLLPGTFKTASDVVPAPFLFIVPKVSPR